MSGVSATGSGFSWIPKTAIDHHQKPNLKSSSQLLFTRRTNKFKARFSSSETHHLSPSISNLSKGDPFDKTHHPVVLLDLDPATAKVAIGLLGPFLSGFGFLFILRIVMSWYPKLPVEKFPYVIAYAPTEPVLAQTRKLIPPLGGVDVTPVVWFALLSFLNEILVGPQGLLVLLSQQL